MSAIVPLIILGGGGLITYKGYKTFKGAGNKILGAPGKMFGNFAGDLTEFIPKLPSIETFSKLRIPEVDIPDLVPEIEVPDVRHIKLPKALSIPKLAIPKIKPPKIKVPRLPWDKKKKEPKRVLTKQEKEKNLKNININRLKMLKRTKNTSAMIAMTKDYRKNRKSTIYFGVGADDFKNIFGNNIYWKVFPKPQPSGSVSHFRR